MSIILFNLKEPYKSLLLSGEKTVEGRLCKGKFLTLKVGDLLVLEESGAALEVLALRKYVSFKEMLEQEGLRNVLPGVKEIEEGIAVYHQFYTPDQEVEFGVLAIQVRPVS